MKRVLQAVIGVALLLPLSLPALADKTVRMATTTLPPSLANPFATANTPTITVTSATYEGLTRLGLDGALKPWLATAWENVDPVTWRFTLRNGVRYDNGAPFDAAAVAAVVEAFIAPGAPTENLRRELPAMRSARVIDSHTVEIVTAEPTPLFPRHASVLLMHEPGALQRLGTEGYARAPVGTGPFRIARWEPNQVTLEAVPGAWRQPKVDRIEIRALPEATARVQGLMTGLIDIGTALGPEEIQSVVAAGGTYVSWTDGTVNGISLVTTRNLPFNDVRVRQALNMAVNRAAIIDVLLQGATVPANQPAGRAVFGHNPDLPAYPYDPERARALLAAAGYPNGFAFTLETSGTGAAAIAVYQQVAADLRAIGVEMEIKLLPTPQFLRNTLQTGEYADAITFPWPSTPTLDILRPVRVHSCHQRHAWYCDQDIMPMLAAAERTFDPAEGLKLRRALAARYHAQAPAIFLYEQVSFAGLSKRLSGYEDAFGFVAYDKIDLR